MAKILIIDKDPYVRQALCCRLEQESHTVITAENGARGVELAASQGPELVILDLVMPDVDGLDVVGQLRRDPVTWDVPVVVLTAQTEAEQRAKSNRLGVTRFLCKPFSPRHLVAEIDRLLSALRAPEPVSAE
jgi:DNA-binding response OmpR family regulator